MHRRAKGFTFIEIMFVILILGILMMVAMPNMRGTFSSLRLKGAARDVTALLRYARNMAVLREAPCEVRFSPDKDTYELVLLDEQGGEVSEKDLSRPSSSRSRSRSHSRRRNRDKQEEVMTVGDDARGVRSLPKEVHFAVIYTAAPLSEGREELPCVIYYPDGSATPATIGIQDNKTQAISVEIFRTTGMARVEQGLPVEQKEQKKLYYGPKHD